MSKYRGPRGMKRQGGRQHEQVKTRKKTERTKINTEGER